MGGSHGPVLALAKIMMNECEQVLVDKLMKDLRFMLDMLMMPC